MRRLVVWIAAVVAVGGVLTTTSASAQSAKTRLTDSNAVRFNDVSDRLICQCGCLMVLRVCNHQNCPSAIPMRKEIEKQIVAGVEDDVIVASFVTEYGKIVLSSPPREGFNLAAWLMPGFMFLVGIALIVHHAGNWVNNRRRITANLETLDPEMVRRIEKELSEEV